MRDLIVEAFAGPGGWSHGLRSAGHTDRVDALGWSGAVFVSNYGSGGDPQRRGRRAMTEPAYTITGKGCRNKWEWPDGTRRNLTIAETGQLQGFPADYPWHGDSTSRQRQIGDAVPPPLAAAILTPLIHQDAHTAPEAVAA